MSIVSCYALGALALLVFAFLAPSIYFTVVLAWISLSFFLVSIAYTFDVPSLFRKRNNGSIPSLVKCLFFPFFVGAQLYNTWARKNDKVPAIQAVTDKLFLACRLFPSDIATLNEYKIEAILDTTAEFDGLNVSAEGNNIAYLNIPVLDHRAPHRADVKKAVNWIAHHINNNRNVVVHCALGRGRSVFVVAAYLLATRRFTNVDDALSFINKSRATANLNKRQREKLVSIHSSELLLDKQSILLVVNPISGGGSWSQHQQMIEQLLSPHYQLNIVLTTDKLSAKEIAKEGLNKPYKMIVACGGDGTVSEVADAIIDTDMCMGIIPLGTTNALSHVLFGVHVKFRPIDLACEVLIKGDFTKIDTATCNNETMVLVAGLGFEQRMITLANRKNKDEYGELAYVQALGTAIHQNTPKRYKISMDNYTPKLIDATSLVIANAAPFSTILAQGAGEPDPTDGKLDITILDTQSNMVLPIAALGLKGLTQSWLGDNNAQGITHKKVTHVHIESEDGEDLDYVLDGEVRRHKYIDINIRPSSLCVMHLT